jgi:hypothetical protein
MHAVTLRAVVISFIALSAAACGKESAPAGDTTSAKVSESKPAADATASADSKDGDADSSSGDAKEKGKKKSNDEMKVERKAKDYITTPDAVFMYSFNESDAKDKAEKACGEKTKGDQAKNAVCMTAAQKKFGADGYHFTQDDSGKWFWEVVQVTKNATVHNLHRVPIEFGTETENSIEVKVIGKDEVKGAKGAAPGDTKFEVPNSYQIIMHDAQDGKVVFEAKLGLLGDQSKRKR